MVSDVFDDAVEAPCQHCETAFGAEAGNDATTEFVDRGGHLNRVEADELRTWPS